MKVTAWSCWLIEVATHSRLTTSYGAGPALRPHVIIQLRDDAGRVGLGEASPLPFFTGETATSIKLQLEQVFLPTVVGQDPLDHDHIIARLDELLPENRSAKCAVDMALYDLRGQISGLPVYAQLGGLRRPDGFAVTRAIGILPIKEAVQEALRWTERGFRTLKLKVGVDARADTERVLAIRSAIPTDARIRIDANQGYDLPTATRVLRALADVVEYCEQPIPGWDLAGLRAIRAETGVPVTVDESVHTMRDLLRVIEAHAADNLVIKLIKCGGLRAAEHLAAVATSSGMGVVVVSPFETHIGAAAGVHLAMSLAPSPYAHELSIFHVEPSGQWTDASVQTMADTVLPPTKPGLGAAFHDPGPQITPLIASLTG